MNHSIYGKRCAILMEMLKKEFPVIVEADNERCITFRVDNASFTLFKDSESSLIAYCYTKDALHSWGIGEVRDNCSSMIKSNFTKDKVLKNIESAFRMLRGRVSDVTRRAYTDPSPFLSIANYQDLHEKKKIDTFLRTMLSNGWKSVFSVGALNDFGIILEKDGRQIFLNKHEIVHYVYGLQGREVVLRDESIDIHSLRADALFDTVNKPAGVAYSRLPFFTEDNLNQKLRDELVKVREEYSVLNPILPPDFEQEVGRILRERFREIETKYPSHILAYNFYGIFPDENKNDAYKAMISVIGCDRGTNTEYRFDLDIKGDSLIANHFANAIMGSLHKIGFYHKDLESLTDAAFHDDSANRRDPSIQDDFNDLTAHDNLVTIPVLNELLTKHNLNIHKKTEVDSTNVTIAFYAQNGVLSDKAVCYIDGAETRLSALVENVRMNNIEKALDEISSSGLGM